MLGILGNKVGMTQIFTKNGNANPVTVIKVGPCTITQIKTIDTDGYSAIQIGYNRIRKISLNKPEMGHLQKTSTLPVKHLKEYRVSEDHTFELGEMISIENFSEGDLVDVTGESIGKGFSGNQKRHNFARGPMTHGSKNHRAPGAIGQGTTPGRVFPGKKMSGALGNTRTTIMNLKILQIDKEKNLLIVLGSVPGKPGNLVSIRQAKKL
jgi:large subunit ribosomal protein L3